MTALPLILHGSFTSSSSYKPMLFLALSGLPFSFRTVNLKNGVQKEAAHLAINRYGQVPVLRHGDLTLRGPPATSSPGRSSIAGRPANGSPGRTTPSPMSHASAISPASVPTCRKTS